MGFWKKVEEEIEFRGISRKELSAMSGVPMTTMNRAMERDSNPFAHDAVRIAQVLGLSVENLLGIPQVVPSAKEFDRQVTLYKKYRHLIDMIESISDKKRHIAVEILEHCATLAAE